MHAWWCIPPYLHSSVVLLACNVGEVEGVFVALAPCCVPGLGANIPPLRGGCVMEYTVSLFCGVATRGGGLCNGLGSHRFRLATPSLPPSLRSSCCARQHPPSVLLNVCVCQHTHCVARTYDNTTGLTSKTQSVRSSPLARYTQESLTASRRPESFMRLSNTTCPCCGIGSPATASSTSHSGAQ